MAFQAVLVGPQHPFTKPLGCLADLMGHLSMGKSITRAAAWLARGGIWLTPRGHCQAWHARHAMEVLALGYQTYFRDVPPSQL